MRTVTSIENGSVKTLCRMCGNHCSIQVHIRQGHLHKITPADGNPVNRGRICPRGASALDIFYHPNRIIEPLKRGSDGTFSPISRDQALDEIAQKMMDIKSLQGARSIGIWKGEAIGFLQQEEYARRFARALGTPNYFSNDSACFNSRYLGHKLVTGFWNPFPYYAEAKLILLFGTNPPVSHPPFMAEFADARANGAALVVIDPRLNPVACYADVFAQPIPGTDGALAWGLIRCLINSGEYDQKLVQEHSVGFEEVAAYAQKFTPKYVEQQSGVYADVIEKVAQLIIENRPKVSLYMGTGLEHSNNGVDTIRAFVILACITGGFDIGYGLFWPEDIPRNSLAPGDTLPEEAGKPIGADRFPVFYDQRAECHTMTAMDYMLGQGEYPLKGLIITGANPAVTNPNTRKVEKALGSLDLLVVNDLFVTRTARLAHYILPAASFLERSEVHIDPKFQRVYLTEKVAEVQGIKDEYLLWHDLAHRMGFGAGYFPWENETQVNRHILEPSGIGIEELRNHPEGITYKPLTFQKHLSRPLPTPTGKIEFASAYLEQFGYKRIPEYVPPYHRKVREKNFPLLLTTGGRKTLFYHSRHQNLEHFRDVHPKAEVEIHPDDAAELGIRNRELVRIVSSIGELEVEAKIVHKDELRQGVVEMYHGWEDLSINVATFDHINDPISGFPLLKGVPVRIEKRG